jgi:hypothetical protein
LAISAAKTVAALHRLAHTDMNRRRLISLSALLVVVVLAACSNTSGRSTESAVIATTTEASAPAVSTTTAVESATTVVTAPPTTAPTPAPTTPAPPTTVVATTTTLPLYDGPEEYLVQHGPLLVELSANCFQQVSSVRVYGWIDAAGNAFETTARPQSPTVVIDTNRQFSAALGAFTNTIYLGIDHFADPGKLDFYLTLVEGEVSLAKVMPGVDVVGECGLRVFWNQTLPPQA